MLHTVAPSVEYWPAAHCVCTGGGDVHMLPAGHGEHVADPDELNCPAAHALWNGDDDDAVQVYPAAHGEHTDEPMAE